MNLTAARTILGARLISGGHELAVSKLSSLEKQNVMDEAFRSGSVQSVDRAMFLLELLSQHDEGCRLSQLVREAGLSSSTTHRLLTTLEKRRHVQFDPRTRRWHIGFAMLNIGSAFLRRASFVSLAQPFLQRLRDQTKETANLGMADDGEIMLVSQIPSRQIVRSVGRIGGRVPMTSSAMGKAILSTYPAEDIDGIIGMLRMAGKTPHSIIQLDALWAELEMVRTNGYAIDNAESRSNVRCIAGVVYNEQAEAICAISISGQLDRMSRQRIEQLAPCVIETAQKITSAVGGSPKMVGSM